MAHHQLAHAAGAVRGHQRPQVGTFADGALELAARLRAPAGIDIGYSSNQGVWNESTTNNSAKVYCPIVTTFNPTNFTPASFDLFYYDKSTAGDVTCTFYALDVGGDIVVSDPETSSGSSNDVQSFSWDAHDNVIMDATYFTVSCTIPKAASSSSSTRSGIVTYNFSQDPV